MRRYRRSYSCYCPFLRSVLGKTVYSVSITIRSIFVLYTEVRPVRMAETLDLDTCCINDAQELQCLQCVDSVDSLLVASKLLRRILVATSRRQQNY
jgi:hypothetical protein